MAKRSPRTPDPAPALEPQAPAPTPTPPAGMVAAEPLDSRDDSSDAQSDAQMVSLTRGELAEIIKSATATAVPATSSTPGAPDAAALVQTLIEALKLNAPPRRITVGTRGEPKTVFNPEGKPRQLKRRYFNNTYEVRPRSLHDREIEVLEKLVAGVYCDGRFKVAVVGEFDPVPEVHILWNNARPEARVEIAKEFGSFAGVLNAIYADQQRQAQEREDFAQYRRHLRKAGSA